METYTIKEIVEHLESLDFTCVDWDLKDDLWFKDLKYKAESKYQTNRFIGEEVYNRDGTKGVVITLKGYRSSEGGQKIIVSVCKNIYEDLELIPFKKLFSKAEHKQREIEKAIEFLSEQGIKVSNK